jgi:hypothetical protein
MKNDTLLAPEERSSYSSISTVAEDIEEVPRYARKNNQPKSKIGLLKEGFWLIEDINPIARYNFVIDRYNQDINKYNDIELDKIPFPKILNKIFDYYILFLRHTFAILLMAQTGMAYIFGSRNYDNLHKYYAYNQTKKNWIVVLLSILGSIGVYFVMYYCYFALLIHSIFGVIITIYGQTYVFNNENRIDIHFYKNMIFDQELDTTNKLNDFITIAPGTIDSFRKLPYFKILNYQYNNRDDNFPQQFMLYSTNLTRELKSIKKCLVKHIIVLLTILLFGTMHYIR